MALTDYFARRLVQLYAYDLRQNHWTFYLDCFKGKSLSHSCASATWQLFQRLTQAVTVSLLIIKRRTISR
jgi:hypothetical protein